MQPKMFRFLPTVGFVAAMFIFAATSLTLAGDPGDLSPRVPPDRLDEAKSLRNPFPPLTDLIAKGKKTYEGKAYCSACHGLEGAGGTSGGRVTPFGVSHLRILPMRPGKRLGRMERSFGF